MKLIRVDSGPASKVVTEWLSQDRPRSSSLYYSWMHTGEDSGVLYVDDASSPSIACSIKVRSDGMVMCCLHVRLQKAIDKPTAEALASEVRVAVTVAQAPEPARVVFKALDSAQYDVLTQSLADVGITKDWQEPTGLFALPSSPASPSTAEVQLLPQGYERCTDMLSDEAAQLVNDTWKYRSASSLAMIKDMLRNSPFAAVVHTDSRKLVSWMLTYDDGSLGMLYVDSEHRRRGLGRCTVCLLLAEHERQTTNAADTDPKFTYVVDSNVASLGMIDQVGFTRVSDCSWMGFSFKGAP